MDHRKIHQYKKFNALEELDLNSNLLLMQKIISKWYNAKPDNQDLSLLKDAIVKVSVIINKMMYEKNLYHLSISEYRQDKLRAIERARRVEQELEKIKTKL